MSAPPVPPVRVLMFPIWHAINPYLDVLKQSLQTAGIEGATLRQLWSVHPPEAVLVHWQENLWVDPQGAKQRVTYPLRRRLLLVLLRSLRRRGSTVVWFAHNQKPHAWEGSITDWVKRAQPFFEQVDAVAHLSETSSTLSGFTHIAHLPSMIVRHPHYALVSPDEHAANAGEITRVLLLGGLERRKNAGGAVRAILDTHYLTAVVTGDGRPTDPALASPRVHVMEGLVSDAALMAVFDGRTVVLLNQPHQINSGVMYLALSRGAPVLCPDTPVNREIRASVGGNWIRLFRPPLTAEVLRSITEAPIPRVLPDLSPFSPGRIGAAFAESFRAIRDSCGPESFDPGPPGSLQGAMDTKFQDAKNS